MTSLLDPIVVTSNSRVAVIEDHDDTAAAMAIQLSLFSTPVRIPLRANMDSLLDQVASEADFAIFDHRLGSGGDAVAYTGAQAAYRCAIPSILITTYLDDDSAAIRQYQARIPRVVKRLDTSLRPDLLREALMDAAAEDAGFIRRERQPFRTVVRVVELQPATVPRVRVVVSAWRPEEAVTLPAEMITTDIEKDFAGLEGLRLLADVNIYASSRSDLYFGNFSEVEEPPSDWMPANG